MQPVHDAANMRQVPHTRQLQHRDSFSPHVLCHDVLRRDVLAVSLQTCDSACEELGASTAVPLQLLLLRFVTVLFCRVLLPWGVWGKVVGLGARAFDFDNDTLRLQHVCV